jgi:hypothetical protein
MTENIINFTDFIKKRSADQNGKISIDDIKELVKLENKDIAWLSSIFLFARYTLFLKNLFYRNHDKKRGINPNTGFMVGFHEDHLQEMKENCCNSLVRMKRPYYEVDAKNKTYIEIVNELTNEHITSNGKALESMKTLLYESDSAIIISNFSSSKVKTKERYLRHCIKILDDAHTHNMFPKSDLIIIDYANFLQRVWQHIGYYLSILSYDHNETEILFSDENKR